MAVCIERGVLKTFFCIRQMELKSTHTALLLIACYMMKQALNRMFRRLQPDSVTELRQISEFARLAFSYNYRIGECFCKLNY